MMTYEEGYNLVNMIEHDFLPSYELNFINSMVDSQKFDIWMKDGNETWIDY